MNSVQFLNLIRINYKEAYYELIDEEIRATMDEQIGDLTTFIAGRMNESLSTESLDYGLTVLSEALSTTILSTVGLFLEETGTLTEDVYMGISNNIPAKFSYDGDEGYTLVYDYTLNIGDTFQFPLSGRMNVLAVLHSSCTYSYLEHILRQTANAIKGKVFLHEAI